MTGINGNITKISNTPHACPKGSVPINFNNAGPKGDKGDKGDPGTSSSSGSNSSVIQYVSSGDEKFPLIFVNWGSPKFVKINGALWRYEPLNPYSISIYPQYGPRPTVGASSIYEAQSLNEILVYLDQNCQGREYGYLSPFRVSPGDLSKDIYNSYAYLFYFEDEAVKMAYSDQAYKARSSKLQLTEFKSWKDDAGCHSGTPTQRAQNEEAGGEGSYPWVVMEITPVETPVLEFDRLITVQ